MTFLISAATASTPPKSTLIGACRVAMARQAGRGEPLCDPAREYASSLIDALRELEGRELSELLIRMRMVNKDDGPIEHSFSVGMGAVTYAVNSQYAASGFRSFEHFLEKNSKSLDKCVNLPPDLRRM